MQKNKSRLTVFYDAPYWVATYERISDGRLEACRIIFGQEPKDYEVSEFLLKNWNNLKFSPSVEAEEKEEKRPNYKRMHRLVKKQLAVEGTGTKSQQALKLQREENKVCRKEKSRRQKEEESQRQFELKQQKRKEKHRGR